MSRALRQSVLVLIFGIPMLFITGAGLLVIWPFISLMDWLTEGDPRAKANFYELLGMWDEFTSTVRSVH